MVDYVQGLPALTSVNETVAATVAYSQDMRDALLGNPVAGVDPSDAYDTGWQLLTINAGWAATAGYTPQFCRIGRVVYLRGRLTGTAAAANSFVTIPDGYGARPSQIMDQGPVAHNTTASGRLFIGPDGVLSCQGMTTGAALVYLAKVEFAI